MNRRYTVLGLSVVLALALAVPALGGPMNPIASISSSAKSIASKALKTAKKAQSAANTAQSTANTALSTANAADTNASSAKTAAAGAQTTANSALNNANAAQTTANSAKTAAAGAQTTANSALNNANAAQTTANTAQTTAESKMSGEEEVVGAEGGSSGSVACPGSKVPTGGGFILGGAEPNSATVVSSFQYLNGWDVGTEQIKGVSGSWTTSAIVECATSP